MVLTPLEAILYDAVRSYSESGESGLSDDVFDVMASEAEKNGTVIPTTVIPSGPWPVTEHPFPMVGISAVARNEAEWNAIIASENLTDGYVSLKYDGSAMVVSWNESGELVRAGLRGNSGGDRGEEVTQCILGVKGLPERGVTPGLVVRGEACISFNNLAILNARRADDGLEPYKFPRSACAFLRSTAAANDRFARSLFTFRAIEARGPSIPADQPGQMSYLSSISRSLPNEFDPIQSTRIKATDAWNLVNHVHDSRRRWQYLLDGLVFRSVDGRLFKLKFPPTAAITTVTDVVWQVSRTGVVAPVCEFESVNIGGTEVRRASVFNADYMNSRLSGLGPGARVVVSKHGDVIPHIEMVVDASEVPSTPPTHCPSCQHETVVDGSILRCGNDSSECPATSIGLLVKFAKAIGLKGLGPGIASAMISGGMDYPANIFSFDEDHLALLKQPGGVPVGEAVAVRLKAASSRLRQLTWGQLLGAVGVPGCAASIMDSVAAAFPDLESLLAATTEQLQRVPGIGRERAVLIRMWIHGRGKMILEDLLEFVVIEDSSGPLSGLSFCVTGPLSIGSRDEVHAMIRSAGGKVKTSVTKDLTHLVRDEESATSKSRAAAKLGIPSIRGTDLAKMIGATRAEIEPNPDDDF